MQVKIKAINANDKKATVILGDTLFETRCVTPANKGSERDLWIDLRPLHDRLGEGEHKNWLTVPRNEEEAKNGVYETLKRKRIANYVSILNLMDYVTPEEYETCRKIFIKAEMQLIPEKLKANVPLTDFQQAIVNASAKAAAKNA